MGGMVLTTNYRCPHFSGNSGPPVFPGVVVMEVRVCFGVIVVGPVLRRTAGVFGMFGLNQVAAAVEEELGPRAVGVVARDGIIPFPHDPLRAVAEIPEFQYRDPMRT